LFETFIFHPSSFIQTLSLK